MRAAWRRRGQTGATYMELVLVIGISATVLVPLLAWTVLVVQAHPDTQDGLERTADAGLLGAYLPDDIAVAGAAAVDATTPVEVEDCRGGEGDAGRVVLVLLAGGATTHRIVYSEVAGGSEFEDGASSIWRRRCDAETGLSTAAVRVFDAVEPGSTRAICSSEEDDAPCRQIEMTTAPATSDRPVVLRGTRRADTESLFVDPTGNRLPVAKIRIVSQTVGEPFSVQLSTEGSHDPDGELVSYRWVFPTQPDGAPDAPVEVVEGGPELADVVHTRVLPSIGTYYVELTVTDDRGATATTYRRITATPRSPVAVASVTPTEGVAGETVFQFTGSSSYDPDGSIASYRWVFGGDEAALGFSHAIDGADFSMVLPEWATAVVAVTLTVTDHHGLTDSYITSVAVTAPGSDPTTTTTVPVEGAPVPVFVATQGEDPATWEFDASGSTDDGEIVSYRWEFGLRPTGGSGVSIRREYVSAGDHRVRLIVTDDSGSSASVEQTVNVPGAPRAPVPRQDGNRIVWPFVAGSRRYLVDFQFAGNGCAKALNDQVVPAGLNPAKAIPPNPCPAGSTVRARVAAEANGNTTWSPWFTVTPTVVK